MTINTSDRVAAPTPHQEKEPMTDHAARIQALVATIRATMQPCPLCGTAAYAVWVVNGEQMFKVGCASCGLELKAAWYRDCSAPTKDIAALWNSRVAAPTPTLSEEIALVLRQCEMTAARADALPPNYAVKPTIAEWRERVTWLSDVLRRTLAAWKDVQNTRHGGNVGATPFYLFPYQCEPEYDQGHWVVVWYDDLYDLVHPRVAAPTPETPSHWQPIETVPDGTDFIIAAYQHHGKSEVGEAFSDGRRWIAAVLNDHIEPTHWMPLPDPPLAGAAQTPETPSKGCQ